MLLSWLEHQASDQKFADSMTILGITLICPWERHLTQALCVVWKTRSTGVCFTMAYTGKKIKTK